MSERRTWPLGLSVNQYSRRETPSLFNLLTKIGKKACDRNISYERDDLQQVRSNKGLDDTMAVSPPGEWGVGTHSPLLPLLPLPTPPTSHSSHPSLYLVQILVTPHSTFLPLPTPPTPTTPHSSHSYHSPLLPLPTPPTLPTPHSSHLVPPTQYAHPQG